MYTEGLVWAVHGGEWKIKNPWVGEEGNSSVGNETSSESKEENKAYPLIISSDGYNHLPFPMVLLAFLELLCSLLHSKHFSG